MNKLKNMTMTAVLLRNIFILILLIAGVGGAVGLSYGYRVIKQHAGEVSHKKVDATASNGNFAALQRTQQYLNDNKDVLEKIALLKATNEFPEFRVVDEIRKIAAKNNIQIESFSYGSSSTESAPATTSPSQATPAAPTTGSTSSSKTIALSVTIKAASYLEFLQFTYDIEQNLPKMKINGIGIKGGTGGDTSGQSGGTPQSSGISLDPLTVEMYIN